MSEDYVVFLREFKRVTAQLDIGDIAKKMGVSKTAVYLWFSITNRMNADNIIKAIWIFGIDMEALKTRRKKNANRAD